METSALLKKVRKIEIKTRGLSSQIFSGEYHSAFKGRGMAFSEVREYLPGDDIRAIDWNVTARFNHPYIKVFEEERELTVMLLVDVSGSEEFGTQKQLKQDVITELCAVLAFSAIQNNDKIGIIFFTDKIEKFIPPKKGKRNVLRVVREILYFKPKRKETKLSATFEHLNKMLTRTSVIFVISDFLDEGYEKSLKILNKRHDVVVIHLKDRREEELPNLGLFMAKDPETGKEFLVDTSQWNLRSAYDKKFKAHQSHLNILFKSLGIDKIPISADQSYIEPIMKFFKLREKRL